MAHSFLIKKHRTKKRLLFQSFALVYLAFLIVSQAATPTTAYFTKKATIGGKIAAGETVGLEEGSEQASEKREKDDTESSEDGADTNSQVDDEETLNVEKEVESDAGTKNSNQTGKDEDVGEKPSDQGETADENDV